MQDTSNYMPYNQKFSWSSMWMPCALAETRQIHTDNGVLWRKRDGTGEPLDPCLDRLLLLFWAHYIEDGPHLLCPGSL